MTADAKQQDINRKVVDRFVYACMSMEIETMLKYGWEHPDDFPTWDNVSNFPSKKDWQEVRDENLDEFTDFILENELLQEHYEDEALEWEKHHKEAEEDFWEWLQEHAPFSDEEGEIRMASDELLQDIELDTALQAEWLEYAQDHGCDVDNDYDEIFEWWLVDPWFAEKLEGYGESILSLSLSAVWGRRTTGQAILLDECITRFAKEWEITDDNTED